MKKFAGVIAGIALSTNPAMAVDFEPIGQIVAKNVIRAGSIITASDIATPGDRDSMRRAYNMVGLETSRTYYRGQTINEDELRSPTLVARNAIVKMEFEKGPLVMIAEGRALDKGGKGDRVRVMNLTSKRVVTATVSGSDSVKAKH